MKHLLLLITLAIVSLNSFSQTTPWGGTKSEWLEVWPMELPRQFFLPADSFLITSDSMYRAAFIQDHYYKELKERNAKAVADNPVDFSKYDLLHIMVFADCNAVIYNHFSVDSVNKHYVLTTAEQYGGCRGMRSRYYWWKVPKLPKGYTWQFKGEELPNKYDR